VPNGIPMPILETSLEDALVVASRWSLNSVTFDENLVNVIEKVLRRRAVRNVYVSCNMKRICHVPNMKFSKVSSIYNAHSKLI
jgi:hypothetical protein